MAHFIFVHGALHGSWCWQAVAQQLRAQGHHVDLVDLPGRPGAAASVRPSLDSYVETIERAVGQAAEPVILAAHSMSGVPTSIVAHRLGQKLRRVVFVNSAVVTDGRSTLENIQSLGEGCVLLSAPGTLTVDGDFLTVGSVDGACAGFYNLCSPEVAAEAAAQLCPEPMGPLTSPVSLDLDALRRVPSVYVGAREDTALPWDYQRTVADLIDADFVELAGDHSPFFSVPDDFVECLSTL